MIEDTPEKHTEGQLELHFFNQDDSDPEELDLQATERYEYESNTSNGECRYCNKMIINNPPLLEITKRMKWRNIPYYQCVARNRSRHIFNYH